MVLIWCLVLGVVVSIPNGVGRTPAMGYNTWNDFRCKGISAENVMKVADQFVTLKLKSFGYEYVNIDDCWCTSRGSDGKLVPDPKAFPHGMKAVADYVHSKGLKFGIYTDRGPTTCAGRPASGGHEDIDAQTFADWGVDYLKEDSCHASGDHQTAFKEYGAMRDALNKTGREIYFSLCGWNSWYAPVGKTLGNSWRIAGDCNAWPSVWNAIHTNEGLAQYAGPGGWNDPDMLVGSSPGAAVHNTEAQSRTQFSLWSVMAAPLLIGSNILNVSAWDLQTYTNTEVIAVDQDVLGKQGVVINSTCGAFSPVEWLKGDDVVTGVPACHQVWSKPLHDGSAAMLFVNYAGSPVTVTCDAGCMAKVGFPTGGNVRDLWAHKDLGHHTTYSASVPANGASITIKLSK